MRRPTYLARLLRIYDSPENALSLRPHGERRISLLEQHTREAIRAAVLKNLPALGFAGGPETVEVNVADLKRQNSTSSRVGGAITVQGTNLWAKKVEAPARAFDAIRTLYGVLEAKGLHRQVPKPLFFDPALGLLFMERIRGRCLLPLVAAGCVWSSRRRFDGYRERLAAVGRWMGGWHSAAPASAYTTLAAMLPALEDMLGGADFTAEEQARLRAHLRALAGSAIARAPWPLITPHNDITLRNIFVDDERFHVIDWDAMVHPRFPPQAIVWWDLITLLMNIESLARLRPLISRDKLSELCSSLWRGYVEASPGSPIGLGEFRTSIMFVVVLSYYCGRAADRPLSRIYRHNLGWRYSRAVRHRLLAGSGSLF